MGRIISDLPDFTGTVADGDLLVCHNVSNPSNKDEKLTVSKLRTDAILARSNTFTVGNQQITSDGASNQALRLKAAANPTVPVLDVRNSSDAVRHELIAEYGTNILAARTMSGYQEFSISPGNIQTNTLTVDVLGTIVGANQAVYMEVIGTFWNNTTGSTNGAIFADDVIWHTGATTAVTAILDNSNRRISTINLVTVNGPTAITGGIRYTVKSTSASLVRSFMTIRAFSQSSVTVTATVA